MKYWIFSNDEDCRSGRGEGHSTPIYAGSGI